MSDSLLFAASPELTNWLTPIWMLGIGSCLGLILLLALWGICIGLSKIPFLGELDENPESRKIVALAIAIGMYVLVFLPLVIFRGFPSWYQNGLSTAIFHSLLAAVILALVAVGCGFAAVTLVSRRTVSEIPLAVNEGVLLWVFVVVVSMASFGILSTLIVKDPLGILASVSRLPYGGLTLETYTIAAPKNATSTDIDFSNVDEQEIPVSFRGIELQMMTFESTEPLEIAAQSFSELDIATARYFRIPGDEPTDWFRSDEDTDLIPNEQISKLFVRNLGRSEATLDLKIVTAPTYPEAVTIPSTAICVVALFLFYVLQRSLMPKLSAVALSTCKSEIAQPMFLIFMAVGTVALLVFVYVPYNTFGEDIKMLKDSGLMLILVFAIIQAVWAASSSVSEEIEGRTALTVLSKPISRREFILGKFFGIVWTVALMFLVLGTVLVIVVAYKPIYDGYEGGGTDVSWRICHLEMIRTVPGLVLGFMEAVVLAALSVAFSTRLPLMANFLTCVSIYVLGHLTPLMVSSSLNRFEIVTFVARLIATVFPVLDNFNIQAAIAGGASVPTEYLGWSFVYSLIYGTIAMLLALVMFEDRDLA